MQWNIRRQMVCSQERREETGLQKKKGRKTRKQCFWSLDLKSILSPALGFWSFWGCLLGETDTYSRSTSFKLFDIRFAICCLNWMKLCTTSCQTENMCFHSLLYASHWKWKLLLWYLCSFTAKKCSQLTTAGAFHFGPLVF